MVRPFQGTASGALQPRMAGIAGLRRQRLADGGQGAACVLRRQALGRALAAALSLKERTMDRIPRRDGRWRACSWLLLGDLLLFAAGGALVLSPWWLAHIVGSPLVWLLLALPVLS